LNYTLFFNLQKYKNSPKICLGYFVVVFVLLTDKDIRIFCCSFCQNKTKQQNAKTKNKFLFFFLLALGAMTCHCLHSVVLWNKEQIIFCCCLDKNNNKIIVDQINLWVRLMLKVGLEPTTLVFSVLRSKPTGAT
jgi:hypothetical protein